MENENLNLTEIIKLVGDAYFISAEHNLYIEVMASAIKELKDNPVMDISIALQHGLNEWGL